MDKETRNPSSGRPRRPARCSNATLANSSTGPSRSAWTVRRRAGWAALRRGARGERTNRRRRGAPAGGRRGAGGGDGVSTCARPRSPRSTVSWRSRCSRRGDSRRSASARGTSPAASRSSPGSPRGSRILPGRRLPPLPRVPLRRAQPRGQASSSTVVTRRRRCGHAGRR